MATPWRDVVECDSCQFTPNKIIEGIGDYRFTNRFSITNKTSLVQKNSHTTKNQEIVIYYVI